jgi:hypothetical protein
MNGWVLTPHKDISFEHCNQPAYWEDDDVYCSKCQVMLQETTTTKENKCQTK